MCPARRSAEGGASRVCSGRFRPAEGGASRVCSGWFYPPAARPEPCICTCCGFLDQARFRGWGLHCAPPGGQRRAGPPGFVQAGSIYRPHGRNRAVARVVDSWTGSVSWAEVCLAPRPEASGGRGQQGPMGPFQAGQGPSGSRSDPDRHPCSSRVCRRRTLRQTRSSHVGPVAHPQNAALSTGVQQRMCRPLPAKGDTYAARTFRPPPERGDLRGWLCPAWTRHRAGCCLAGRQPGQHGLFRRRFCLAWPRHRAGCCLAGRQPGQHGLFRRRFCLAWPRHRAGPGTGRGAASPGASPASMARFGGGLCLV